LGFLEGLVIDRQETNYTLPQKENVRIKNRTNNFRKKERQYLLPIGETRIADLKKAD
jgi:hypothetical protein